MTLALTFKSERDRKVAVATAIHVRNLREERKRQAAPGGLLRFMKYFWDVLEPDIPFMSGWALAAVCEHLEAVSRGQITRLLINISPGACKSLTSSVFWPAWEWSAFGRPGLRYLCLSSSSTNPEKDNGKLLRLLTSKKFQDMYGKSFSLVKQGETVISNDKTGVKTAAGLGGTVTGARADRIILDDPNSVKQAESEAIREGTSRFFREGVSNRLNHLLHSAIIVIQQRVHEQDVTGTILEDELDYTHLCIPMCYDPDRHCSTKIGWEDPRTEFDECFWPERYPDEAVAAERKKGPYYFSGQCQQNPEIRGGGLFKRADWQHWEPQAWPKFSYIIASLDPAFTAKQANDPSGFTIWGCFSHEGEDCAILLHAWRKWLPLHGPDIDRQPGETDDDYRERCRPSWGLVETVAEDCRRFKCAKLLIENKASGHDVSTEMYRLHTGRTSYAFVDPKGLDKHARCVRVQPEFSNGQIWARTGKKYAQLVIDEMAVFPKGKYDDLCDSTTQCIFWLRNHGFLKRRSEKIRERTMEASKYGQEKVLYEC